MLTQKQILLIIENEIAWCKKNAVEGDMEQRCFIAGLNQAKYLIREANRAVRRDKSIILKESRSGASQRRKRS